MLFRILSLDQLRTSQFYYTINIKIARQTFATFVMIIIIIIVMIMMMLKISTNQFLTTSSNYLLVNQFTLLATYINIVKQNLGHVSERVQKQEL